MVTLGLFAATHFAFGWAFSAIAAESQPHAGARTAKNQGKQQRAMARRLAF